MFLHLPFENNYLKTTLIFLILSRRSLNLRHFGAISHSLKYNTGHYHKPIRQLVELNTCKPTRYTGRITKSIPNSFEILDNQKTLVFSSDSSTANSGPIIFSCYLICPALQHFIWNYTLWVVNCIAVIDKFHLAFRMSYLSLYIENFSIQIYWELCNKVSQFSFFGADE